MSVPRNPLFSQITPRHNSLPTGSGLWWPLHGAFTGMPDTPAMTELVMAGSANASKWTADTLMYSFPSDNGNTNQVGLIALHDDDAGASTLDQILTLYGSATGTQILISCTVWWVDQQTAVGYLWGYGQNTSASLFGLALTTGDKPSFIYRGKEATSSTTLSEAGANLTLSGTSLDTFTRSADVQSVTSIRVTSSTTADIEIKFGNGTSTATYTGTMNAADNSGTDLPGQNTRSAAVHGGFAVGCKFAGSSTVDQFFGRGASPANSARIGNVCVRRFSSYDSTRCATALTNLLARRDDYPDSWLT